MNTTLSIILPGVLIIVNIILIIIVVNMNKRNREEQRFLLQELQRLNRENREDVTLSLSRFSDSLNQNFSLMRDSSDKSMNMLGEIQKEKLDQIEKRQGELIINTEKKLEHIRATVEEKLEKTLSERLGRSFETVGKQLIEVQKGLGEMQVLAQDVGGLKRVLSNVKMRGGIGEVQLSMLLEQILAPEQYESNVKTKQSGRDFVEFAIKLPGKEGHNKHVWLPVDAKFPKEYYETLQNAYDTGDLVLIEKEQKSLENAIKFMAKEISEKYINPPATTDFAIMFLPFEGIYAEVVRKAALLEEIQTKYKVLITGPTTFAAILNSLQMGFRTLAIEKRSGEVWNILGAVKKEFSTFGDLLQKAQKNIQGGLDDIDKLVGTRTRAIQRKLSSVETMGIPDVKLISDDDTNALLPPSEEE
ncbi:MAG: recombinase RmuC [Bacteroidetes bacterium GWE2_39_28]|nr:MAG: recombinase RmuC [Bacteroidetes bacterium GWE2_39_28]OFY15319.1 MAG: recombinase RmuC [Bacteroidetes bacterium GWF2_39_10]OFZ07465.1 MAG: recombinase RmuC [Bacteroidetes bacterium RIFOXYB2_FULL_39_7]OFZ11166.1 MAG: recombinase RmuC [Bacteroidetes bacterium RIFOXYC2_FULL_39_11]